MEPGDVAPNAAGVVTVVARVNADVSDQTLVNTVRIGNDRQETDYTNNEDSVPVVVKQLANVWIAKSGPTTVRLGGEAVYTLTYGNNGNLAAADVMVSDTLPEGMTFVSAAPAPTSAHGQVQLWTRNIEAPVSPARSGHGARRERLRRPVRQTARQPRRHHHVYHRGGHRQHGRPRGDPLSRTSISGWCGMMKTTTRS